MFIYYSYYIMASRKIKKDKDKKGERGKDKKKTRGKNAYQAHR